MFPKLNRQTLAEQVFEELIGYIQQQGLKPGDHLPSETKLAGAFGVSRPIVREAMRRLAGQGIVETAQGKSAIVSPISAEVLTTFFRRAISLDREHVLELLEVRRGLEVESARLAAMRRTSDTCVSMRRLIASMGRRVGRQQLYVENDLELHLLIASATQNSLLYHLIESIRHSLAETMEEGLRQRISRTELEAVQRHHEAIVEAICAGDAITAAASMNAHFDDAVAAITRSAVVADVD